MKIDKLWPREFEDFSIFFKKSCAIYTKIHQWYIRANKKKQIKKVAVLWSAPTPHEDYW